MPWNISYYENGSIFSQDWSSNSEDYPKYISYHKNGNIKTESWGDVSGKTCKTIHYSENGMKLKEFIYQNRNLFKRIRYDDIGLIEDETWYNDKGEIHRDNDEPAYISHFYKNNRLVSKMEWYKHGKVHRDDKPARTTFYESGSIETEKWFQNDVCTKTVFHDDLIYTNDFVSTGDNLSLDF